MCVYNSNRKGISEETLWGEWIHESRTWLKYGLADRWGMRCLPISSDGCLSVFYLYASPYSSRAQLSGIVLTSLAVPSLFELKRSKRFSTPKEAQQHPKLIFFPLLPCRRLPRETLYSWRKTKSVQSRYLLYSFWWAASAAANTGKHSSSPFQYP